MSETSANTFTASSASATGKKPLSSLFLFIGLAGIILGLIGMFLGVGDNNFRPVVSWLIGFSFWLSILVGCLFMVMIFHVFDSGWAVIVRRQLEHVLAAFPWVVLIFLPLLLIIWFGPNPGILWKWMNPDHVLPSGYTVANDVLYIAKEPYLNKTAFTLRSLLFLGTLLLFATCLRRQSFALDRTANPSHVHKSRVLAAGGIFACGMAASFMAIDWFMSIEYHWFSTMYGVWFFAASMRAAIAFTLILCFFQATRGVLQGIYKPAHNYDLGCMALAFTVFWAYISFSQYFLIYQANIPEEVFWFNIRQMNADGTFNSWWWVSLSMIFLYFLMPFLFLLFYKSKVKIKLVLFLAGWILTFHLVDLYWNILPAKKTADTNVLGYDVVQFGVTFWDIAVLVGVGGIVLWAYLKSVAEQEVIPVHDPRIEESVNHHE